MITDFEGDQVTAEKFAKSLINWGLEQASEWENIHTDMEFTPEEVEEVDTLFSKMKKECLAKVKYEED